MAQFRQATIDEAVESILRCQFKESRKQQLAWFKENYGDNFATELELIVKKRFKGKRNE